VQISISSLILQLFQDVLLVQSDDSCFEFLEVCYEMKTLENVILELLLVTLLIVQFMLQFDTLICESLLSHPQIIDYQSQIIGSLLKVL
jgi:hypothetical protein